MKDAGNCARARGGIWSAVQLKHLRGLYNQEFRHEFDGFQPVDMTDGTFADALSNVISPSPSQGRGRPSAHSRGDLQEVSLLARGNKGPSMWPGIAYQFGTVDSGMPGRIKVFDKRQSTLFAAFSARKGIDRIGDSVELGCELPRFVRRKRRMSAVEIDMHLIIKSKYRAYKLRNAN
jgi:hypothetical protein